MVAIWQIAVAGAVTPRFAAAADLDDPSFYDSVGQVVCNSRSLTVCQGEFCYVSFNGLEKEKVFFDFVHGTYVYPAISPDTKPMRIADIVQTEGHYAVKFAIDLVHGSSNVEFIANLQKNGALEMSAAGRISYPGNANRAPIIAINGMACETGVAPR